MSLPKFVRVSLLAALFLGSGSKEFGQTSGNPPQDGTLDILTPPNTSVAIGDPLTLAVITRNLPATLEGAYFVVTDDFTTATLPTPFSTATNDRLPANRPVTISFASVLPSFQKTLSAKAGLVLLYRSGDSTNTKATSSWSFNLVRPAPDIVVAVHPMQVSRTVPFKATVLSAKNENACLTFQSIPTLSKIRDGTSVSGDVFEANPDAAKISGTKLAGTITGDKICLDTTIPGNYAEVKGKLSLSPPLVKKQTDIDVDLRVKDLRIWRAIAAILSSLPALMLLYWTTTVRRRLLNQSERETTASRLAQLLASNPGLANDSSVVFVRQLILDSRTADKTGEFDTSVQSLASANSRLDQLFASPPTVSSPVSAGGLAIRILNPPQKIISGERIVFVIGAPNPSWPSSGGTYRWTVSSAGEAITTHQGVGMRRFEYVFETAGPYEVSVTVNKANSEVRTLTVLQQPQPSVILRFKVVQVAMIFATVLLATGTAYLMTESAPTFGTFGDYFKLFASSFGVSGGTSSVAAILSAVGKRS